MLVETLSWPTLLEVLFTKILLYPCSLSKLFVHCFLGYILIWSALFSLFRMAKTIIEAILGLCFDDSPSDLAAATIFYVLTSDVSHSVSVYLTIVWSYVNIYIFLAYFCKNTKLPSTSRDYSHLLFQDYKQTCY